MAMIAKYKGFTIIRTHDGFTGHNHAGFYLGYYGELYNALDAIDTFLGKY
jgi:hypothetical protein